MKLAMIDICTACTAKCKYCLHQYRNMATPRFMSMENFKSIVSILFKEGYDYIYPYLSGEPLLHKEYWEMIGIVSSLRMFANTATKLCFNINFEKAEEILENLTTPIHFDITIDSDRQSIQDQISKGISTEQVFFNLKRLYDISRGNHVSFSVVTVVNRYNEPFLPDIERRVQSCGNFKYAVKPMGYYMGYKMTHADSKMIAEMAPKYSPRFSIDENNKITSKMTACSNFIKPVIGPEGEVTICCHDMLYRQARWNVIETGSLDRILNDPEYKRTVELGRKMKFDICKECN